MFSGDGGLLSAEKSHDLRNPGVKRDYVQNEASPMHRTTLSLIRNFASPICLFVGALILKTVAVNLADSPYLAGLYTPTSWASLGVFLISLIMAALAGYRAWRWAEGRWSTCDCGGILGRVRDGIRGRSDYRKCFGCGRSHPFHS